MPGLFHRRPRGSQSNEPDRSGRSAGIVPGSSGPDANLRRASSDWRSYDEVADVYERVSAPRTAQVQLGANPVGQAIAQKSMSRMNGGDSFMAVVEKLHQLLGAVTPERLRPGQKVMHPGPMNRGVEIDPRVADAVDSLVELQVRAGLVTRMAVLYDLLTSGPIVVKTETVLEVA